jgi:hypothetical protein
MLEEIDGMLWILHHVVASTAFSSVGRRFESHRLHSREKKVCGNGRMEDKVDGGEVLGGHEAGQIRRGQRKGLASCSSRRYPPPAFSFGRHVEQQVLFGGNGTAWGPSPGHSCVDGDRRHAWPTTA